MLLEIICIQCVNGVCPSTCEWGIAEKITLDSVFLHFFCMLHLLTDIFLDHSIQIWRFSETSLFQGFVPIREPYIVHAATNDSPGCNPSTLSQSQDVHPSVYPFDHSSGRPFIWSCSFAIDNADDLSWRCWGDGVMNFFSLSLSISRSWSCVDGCINSISSSYCSFRPTANS